MGSQFPDRGLRTSCREPIDELMENRHLGDTKVALPENSEGVSCQRDYKRRSFGRSAFRNENARHSDGILTTVITVGLPESERLPRK